jgi:uncharacterized protein involved in exopolysaccharide biosynthesis
MRPSTGSFGQWLALLLGHPVRWLLPTLLIGGLVGLYAMIRPPTWEASQTLIIRNEAANNQAPPGKFSQTDEMKTVQETILELSKDCRVLAEALQEVGPPADNLRHDRWPSPEDVANFQEAVKLAPPKGAEFGRTEVFYLRAKSTSRQRAIQLADAVCQQLESSFQELRNKQAQSMIHELERTVHIAEDDLANATRRLNDLERRVGSDLGELRILSDATSGESALRRTITEIRAELRQARAAQQSQEEILALLEKARQDPRSLTSTPRQLLESQPALKRLKEGLIDAQLRSADLQGRMSDSHPLVLAAKQSEEEINHRLYDELASSVRGVQAELRLGVQRIAMLEEHQADAARRLDQLAALRAPYVNFVAETRNRGELLQRAQQRLAEVRGNQATATTADLIARINQPDTGPLPVGLGRGTLVLLGMAFGLMTGFGVVYLTAPAAPAISPLPAIPSTVSFAKVSDGRIDNPALSFNESLEKILRSRRTTQP